ncbi:MULTISPECIES: ATP-binding protein [unclassified Adlercreutzia]|uniref:ATP-binding protein n=1 Tax=unclassified Adlercreutzia TaxID=2636013 RepID=UPI0013EE1192|nr:MULTISPECIES: ATP-binding protein [unclassified Adlercreutzia]
MSEKALTAFVESVCGDSHLRVEQDFGGGYVRLRSTEAEKRQAAQDIRSTEDIVIELLRNARDAGARQVFVAAQRDDVTRTLTVIDDGCGIPEGMRTRVFEPRVTSKLETAHMDKWGMHGRGMALYSVSVNAEEAYVAASCEGAGTSLVVRTNLEKLKEKTDQSTFPHFEVRDGVHAMRGPRNIVRTAAEFALEHRRECSVYFGSATEIAATLYEYGTATTSLAERTFAPSGLALTKRLATATDPAAFAQIAAELGLPMSERSARRILDGAIKGAPPLLERLQAESFPAAAPARAKAAPARDMRGLKLAEPDAALLREAARGAFADVARRYYLEPDVEPRVRVTQEAITITIPVEKLS